MKVFRAHGYISSPCGCCYPDLDTDEIVVAVTEPEALGLLLEMFESTMKKHWDIQEVDLTRSHVNRD